MKNSIDDSGEIKVTVCVVTYNQENYIRQCLQSIVEQKTDFKFVVIVSDDCSKDGTQEIVQEFARKFPDIVKPILRENNIGAYANYVSTHNAAESEYVCHCDGDDRWLPGKLQAQYDFLNKNSEYTVCWTRTNLFTDSGAFYSGLKADLSYFGSALEVDFSKALRVGAVGFHVSLMYRRNSRMTKSLEDRIDVFYTWESLSFGKGKIIDNVYSEKRLGSPGAITRNSGTKIKRLYALHAKHFLNKFPERKSDIFVFSLMNFIVDVKNNRNTSKLFFDLLIDSFCLKGVFYFIKDFNNLRRFRVPKFLLKEI